ncbi:hypothetical protein BDZ89DRAFT_942811 [Hymenopellis radicata]|nr:hypothetical protein BDZ89DRAFT_942811 [Hymenopellis radicata]
MDFNWGQAYSSHYAQAYQQPTSVASTSTSSGQVASAPPPAAGHSSWYQSGHVRCTQKNCSFTGSAKTVETHMMDRHLIYPPGYQKRREWDADPALKGKAIPIQGTTLILDSPDALEAWIAERKRRWPSSARVEEKKRKMDEAAASGQLSAQDLGLFGKKRKRTNDSEPSSRPSRGGRGRSRGRGHVDAGWRGRGRGGAAASQRAVPADAETSSSSSDSDSDPDGEPEISTSKPHPDASLEDEQPLQPIKPLPKRQPFVPKASSAPARPSLLRNLLLPEIRMTVSNLSQAIHFLVENDFLMDVEMKPGEASDKMIQVVDDSQAPTT